MLQSKDVSEVVEILLRNHAAKSLLATKCRELNDVEVTQVSEPAEDSDDPDNGIKAKVVDYDKVARDESMAVARLAGSWTQIKRVEEPSAGDAGADNQSAADEIEDMVVDAVNEAKEREKTLSE